MFAGETEAYPSEAFSGTPLLGRVLALPANIRLGWRGLPGSNTLAYYENPLIPTVKSFIVQVIADEDK